MGIDMNKTKGFSLRRLIAPALVFLLVLNIFAVLLPKEEFGSARAESSTYTRFAVIEAPADAAIVLELTVTEEPDISEDSNAPTLLTYINDEIVSDNPTYRYDNGKLVCLIACFEQSTVKVFAKDGTEITAMKLAGDTATAFTATTFGTIESIDVSDSANLKSLTLYNLPALTAVDASNCALSEIIIDTVPNLTTLDCSGNGFTFSELPAPSAQLINYNYDSQSEVVTPAYVDSSGIINLKDCHYILTEGESVAYQTEYKWYYADGTEVPEGSITAVNAGYFSVDPALAGSSVYCEMTHGSFPQLTLKTTTTTVVENLEFSISPVSNAEMSFKLSGEETPSVYAVDESGTTDITSLFTLTDGVFEAVDELTGYDCVYVTSASPVTELYVSDSDLKEVNVSACSALEVLSISGGTGAPLDSLDLMLNTALKDLTVSSTDLGTLNLYANSSLENIDLSSNKLSSVVFPAANAVKTLDISGNSFAEFDFSAFTVLTALDASDNMLASADLSACTALTDIDLSDNILSSVELCDSVAFTKVDISGNRLNYASLPTEPLAETCTYTYDNQSGLTLDESYAVEDEIDVSSCTGENCGTTTYALYVNGVKHSENTEGKFTVTQDMSGYEISVTASNDKFTDLVLESNTASVEEKLLYKATVSLSSDSDMSFAAVTDGRKLHVDWGDGKPVPYVPAEDGTVSVSGNALTADNGIYNIHLYCAGTLKELDLGYTSDSEGAHVIGINTVSCTDLEVLDISAPAKGTDSSRVTVLDVSANTKLTELYAENNGIYSLDLTKNTNLVKADISDNNITETDLSKNTALSELDISGNALSALDISALTALTKLDCSGNKLTFVTLPDDFSGTYTYAPQKDILIASTVRATDTVDLSALNTVNGKNTVYKWVNAETGAVITPTTSNNGVFTFEKGFDSVKAYCEMTNEEFPDLTLRTSETVLSSAMTEFTNPTAVLCTSLTAGQEVSLSVLCDDIVYIDWGDGNIVSTAGITTDVQTAKKELEGTVIKLYTNGELTLLSAEDMEITSVRLASATDLETLDLSGNKLTSIDLSKNTALKSLDISDNSFTLTALPLISTVTDYKYSPQADYAVSSLKAVGGSIDLTALSSYNNTASAYALYKKNSTETLDDDTLLTVGTDYTFSGTGKLQFLDPLAGSTVYCVVTNPLFPDFTTATKGMKTTDILITSGGEFTLSDSSNFVYTITIEEGSVCTDSKGTVIAAGDLKPSSSSTNNTLLTFSAKKFNDTTYITTSSLLAKVKELHSSFDATDNCHYIYDLSLLDGSGNEMKSFEGNIKVTLHYLNTSLAAKYQEYDFYIFHYITSGSKAGTMEQIPVTASSDGLTFTAKSFSPYILVYQADPESDSEKNNTDGGSGSTSSTTSTPSAPDAGDNTLDRDTALIILLISVLILTGYACFHLRRKENKHLR